MERQRKRALPLARLQHQCDASLNRPVGSDHGAVDGQRMVSVPPNMSLHSRYTSRKKIAGSYLEYSRGKF